MQLDVKIIKEPTEYLNAIDMMNYYVNMVSAGNMPSTILILEHDHIYTCGTSSGISQDLPEKINGIDVVQVGRGGKITYHGPGQKIIYPIINLKELYNGKIDIRNYVTKLENAVINFLQSYNIQAYTVADRVGIWVNTDNMLDHKYKESKIASIGIRVTKGIAHHGVAININPEMKYFEYITPCGLEGYGTTSLKFFKKLEVKCNEDDLNQSILGCFYDQLVQNFIFKQFI